MPEEGFLRRWARVKASGGEAVAEAQRPAAPVPSAAPAAVIEPVPAAPLADPAQAAGPAPTLEDAAQLTPASDFSAFVSRHVDKDVRRLALKKLFADPHFNVMDRLDMYMDDYNKADPVSATMLAALDHARGVLRRPEEVQAELARLAARDAPADAALRALEGELAAAQGGAEEAVAADEAGREGADAPAPGAPVPDTRVRLEPDADTSIVVTPAPSLPVPAIEHAGDTIALPSPRAHNAEARP
jgi:hypothetical protein